MQGPYVRESGVVQRPRIEVNSVQAHWLPFENVGAAAHVVRSRINREDKTVVFVFELGKDVFEEDVGVLDTEHLLHVQINLWNTL